MAYGFDLSKVTLERFEKLIQEGYLIPSMRTLREGIEERFSIIKSQGITRVSELGNRIANQKKADDFAEVTGIDVVYMTSLRRLVSSYKAKPRKLAEFPDIGTAMLKSMADSGLKTSKTLFEYMEKTEMSDVQKRLGLSEAELQHIRALMEVTQLRYVSPLFATAMIRSGYNSIAKVAGSERVQFMEALIQINKTQNIYKGNIGDTDVQFLIDDGRFFLELR